MRRYFYDQTDDGLCTMASQACVQIICKCSKDGEKRYQSSNKNVGKGNVYVYLDVIKSYLIKLCRFVCKILLLNICVS